MTLSPNPVEARGRQRGLDAASVDALRAEFGPNVLVPTRTSPNFLQHLVKPFTDPMAVLLLVAGATYLALGDRFDALITLIALAPVTVVTVVLEGRAERALDRLRRLSTPIAAVWRGGVLREITVESIVPGDEVFIREGDVVAADGRLSESSALTVDESSLTGESQPVDKHAGGVEADARVFAGTTVSSGRGTFAVEAIGQSTRYGAIGELLATARPPATPMQQRIGRLVRRLSVGAVGICLLVTAIEAWRGHSFAAGVIAGVSLAMAAIPEEFPMVYALYLALGAWRLTRDSALVRRLSSVETLGSTTVICTDKTGTLTTGRVEAADDHRADGVDATMLWDAAVLACEPEPFDALDRAILRAAETNGVVLDEIRRGGMARAHAFDPLRKLVTRVWRAGDGYRAAAKGAIEGVLAMSAAPADVRRKALAANERFAGAGMRVLAVAGGGATADTASREDDERGLQFLGLIAFSDPVRDGVAATLAECATAGIRVLIVTGDHALTARAVAERLGLPPHDVVTGDAIDAVDEEQLVALCRSNVIFARTRPEQKHRLVKALQQHGDVVAMTGDGTNDAPALREADIGIAMGLRGTEVAREAADLILLDDDFSTIVRAVRDGRRIFDNLQRAFSYLIAFHMPLLLAAFALPLVGAPLLLLPVHLVWLEVIVHPTSSLVFEADAGAPDLMRRPPRQRDAELLPPSVMLRATIDGTVLASAVIVLYLHQLSAGLATEHARAEAIAAMIVGQTALVLLERRPDAHIWRAAAGANLVFVSVVMATLAGLVAATEVPGLAAALRMVPLDLASWGTALAVGIGSTLWREPVKAYRAWRARRLQSKRRTV